MGLFEMGIDVLDEVCIGKFAISHRNPTKHLGDRSDASDSQIDIVHVKFLSECRFHLPIVCRRKYSSVGLLAFLARRY
jgi:hypothetical protein